MKRKAIVAISIISVLPILAWCPWITDAYATDRVVDHLGGNDTKFMYLGEEMTVRDVPKGVIWYPFAKAVYFPSEAVWFVTFYGGII